MYRQPSHAGLAALVADQGRGDDSMLVHMTPDEVRNLGEIARSMGTEMPLNPATGYPEAGWLSDLLGRLAGGIRSVGQTVLSNPQLTGAVVGGTYGLLKGDLRKGLEAGMKAYAGSSLLGGIASGMGGEDQQRGEATAGEAKIPSALQRDLFKTGSSETDRMLPAVKPTVQQPQMGGGLFSNQSPLLQALTLFGLNRLEQKYGGASQAIAPKSPVEYRNVQFSRGRVNPRFGEPGQPYFLEGGYTDYGDTTKYPGYTGTGQSPPPTQSYPPPNLPYGMAMGGIVPDSGAIPAPNSSYPMANIKTAGYSTASQMPRSAELLGGYDTAVDPFTGEEVKSQSNFADGGQVQGKEEELKNYFDNLRPFAPALSDQYRNDALNTGIGSLKGVPVNTADGNQPFAPALADWYKSLLAPPGPPRDRIDLSEYFKTTGFRGANNYGPVVKYDEPCPTGQTRNSTTGQCESTPPPPPPKQCPDDEINVGGVCFCPPGKTRNTLTGKCETTGTGGDECKGGKQKDSAGNCVCPQGSKDDGTGTCVGIGSGPCPEGQTRDPVTGECKGTGTNECPTGQTRDPVTGECKGTSTNECPTGQTRDPVTGECKDKVQVCPDGNPPDPVFGCYRLQVKTCPDGQTVPEDQPCCKKDIEKYDPVSGKCVDITAEDFVVCPEGTKNAGQRVPKSKYPDACGGDVTPPDDICPPGTVTDEVLKAAGVPFPAYCKPSGTKCPEGQEPDPSDPNKCRDIQKPNECTGGKIRNAKGDCVCPEGKEDNGSGQCVDIKKKDDCLEGFVYDPARAALKLNPCVEIGSCTGGKVRDANNACVCPDGSKEDPEGNCVKITNDTECKGGKVKDSKGDCVCPEGTKEDGSGNCKPSDTKGSDCTGGKVPDGKGGCECPEGTEEGADGKCGPSEDGGGGGGGKAKCDADETQVGDMCFGQCSDGATYTRGIGGQKPCGKPANKDDPNNKPDDPNNPLKDFFRICPDGHYVWAWESCDGIPNSQLFNKFLNSKDIQFGGKYGTGLNAILAAWDTYKNVAAGKEGASALSGYGLGTALANLASSAGWTTFAAGGPMGVAFAAIAALGASLVQDREMGDVALRNYWRAIDQGRGFGMAPPVELAQGFINFYRTNKNEFPGQAAYGRTGNEDFLYDMTQLINKAAETGYIKPGANADQIYASVVKPWLNSMGSGPQNDAARHVQDFMMTDLIYNYMIGRPISNAQVKGDSKFRIVSDRPVYSGVVPDDMKDLVGTPWQQQGGGGGGNVTNDNERIMLNAEGGVIMAKRKKKYATGGIAALNSGAMNPMEGYNFGFAQGGMAAMPEYKAGGKLLRGEGDGMSDDIPAVIRGKTTQRAALADGEFVIPADVVSHLGNGSTEAGAKKLYKMMAQIRRARTGRGKQAPRVNPDKFLPRV